MHEIQPLTDAHAGSAAQLPLRGVPRAHARLADFGCRRDLYPDPLHAAAAIENLRDHPFTFYRHMGFVVVGVLPDANGFGKPDIFMAKRLRE